MYFKIMLTVTTRTAFEEANGDTGATLELSDGSSTNVWTRKTFTKEDGSALTLEKGQQVNIQDLDSGDLRLATVMAIRANSIDVALSETQWEMRFPSAQLVEPA
jgi:hypothetical protein